MNRIVLIQKFIDLIEAKTYLEIGVRNGDSFLPIKCQNKIAVDVNLSALPVGNETRCDMTSDEYFAKHATHFDVAFIDGDHTYTQSLRDAENCLKWMNPKGYTLLHDCNPTNEECAISEYGSYPDWSGEVWKTILTLRADPELYVYTIDIDCGIGVVTKGSQVPLRYSTMAIRHMTYKDLETNREKFLNLVKYEG